MNDFGHRLTPMKHRFGIKRCALFAGFFLAASLFAAETNSTKVQVASALYENNLEKAEADKLPDEFMVQEGNFLVKDFGTNKVLELPGAPVETLGLFFGPTESSEISVSVKIFGTAKGRRFPTFGVGLNGPSGYRLMMAPAKKTLELYRNEEFQTSVPCEWKSGEWLNFKLQLRKIKDGEWKAEGKVWGAGAKEPAAWCLSFDDKTEPVAGRASIWGSPLSGTPIDFDELAVGRVSSK